MKAAIILSCVISAFFLTAYSVVMSQIRNLEDFYGNMDKYVSASMNSQNTPEHPYIPQSIKNTSQPLKNSPVEFLGN